LLALLVTIVFCQTGRYDFVNFDDDRYVYDNPHVKQGLAPRELAFYVIHRDSYTYHPLSTYSHMLDCQLFGLDAGKHHWMNVILHLATAVGLFLVLREMTGRLWPAAMVAAVFAIHPLRVESVAWIAERKDVLSGLFFVLTLAAYSRYVRKPYAKPMLVTVPLVLLLLDYWPLGRWRLKGRELSVERREFSGGPTLNCQLSTPNCQLSTPNSQLSTLNSQLPWHLLIEKVPLIVLSLFDCLITIYTQSDGGAIQSLATVSLAARIANTFVAYMNYVGCFFWPRGLAVLYPHPLDSFSRRDAFLMAWLLVLLSAGALFAWRRMPYLLVGWLWYLGTLVPVIGLLQVGGQSMADRYTYVPQIGLAIALVWAVTAAADRLCKTETRVERRELRSGQTLSSQLSPLNSPCSVLLAVASVGIVAALSVVAWRQTAYWRNSETLWTRDLMYPTIVAHYDFGLALAQEGRHDEAIEQYKAGLEIDPTDQDSLNNLGLSYEAVDDMDAAMQQYRAVLRENPKAIEANNNLARLLRERGDDREALQHLRTAHRTEPSNFNECSRLADLLATSPDDTLRDGNAALHLARRAVELSEGKDAAAFNARAAAHAEQRNFTAAVEDAQTALRLAVGDKKLADEIRERLEIYHSRQPFRQKPAMPSGTKTEKRKRA
jgi:Tfp pilus assembly protein PilF